MWSWHIKVCNRNVSLSSWDSLESPLIFKKRAHYPIREMKLLRRQNKMILQRCWCSLKLLALALSHLHPPLWAGSPSLLTCHPFCPGQRAGPFAPIYSGFDYSLRGPNSPSNKHFGTNSILICWINYLLRTVPIKTSELPECVFMQELNSWVP